MISGEPIIKLVKCKRICVYRYLTAKLLNIHFLVHAQAEIEILHDEN